MVDEEEESATEAVVDATADPLVEDAMDAVNAVAVDVKAANIWQTLQQRTLWEIQRKLDCLE